MHSMILATLDRDDTLSVERSAIGGLRVIVRNASGTTDVSLSMSHEQAASLAAALAPWLATEGA